jgi:hypothetical protein
MSCVFVRHVRGRRNQRYLLCRNPEIEAKYPRQPVLECRGYESAESVRYDTRNGGS